MHNKVSIKRCGSYDPGEVYSAVKGAVDLLGGIGRFVKPGERILIKPNLLAGKPPEKAVTTHPAMVKAMIRLVRDAGARPFVGDSPGMGSVFKIAERCAVMNACREEGAPLVDLSNPVIVENPAGHTFRRLEVSRDALNYDGIINVPKLKTHAQMFLTLGVKNLFGCVPGKLKPQWHLTAGVDSAQFSGMLLDLYLYLKPRLTVMDAVVGMEGNGPGSGDPRLIGLVFAAPNAIAMDTVVTEVLGAKPEDLPILKTARMRGIKEAEMANIETLGEEMRDIRVKGFRFPPLAGLNFAAALPYFVDKRLRKALTSRPHVDHRACTLCNVCVEVCPPEIMRKTGRIEIDYSKCIRCYCCQEMCPHGAISSREGWLKRIIPGL